MSYSTEERTTHICFTETGGSAFIESCNHALINKINKIFDFDLRYNAVTDNNSGVQCYIPKKNVCIQIPMKNSKEYLKAVELHGDDFLSKYKSKHYEKNDKLFIPMEDRETHICFTEADDRAYVYTNNKALMKKLDMCCEFFPGFSIRNRDYYLGDYIIPKKYISIRKTMEISDEIRAKKALEAKGLTEYRTKRNEITK